MQQATAKQPHILVVDDDDRIRGLLREYLRDNDFAVSTAGDAVVARKLLHLFLFDLLVLDIMMPGESGLELAADINNSALVEPAPPILLLTAMAQPQERIKGLESGADDYLTKPFEPRELLLRIRAILRRSAGSDAAAAGILRFGEFTFDRKLCQLQRNGQPVHLTPTEAKLLEILAEHVGQAVSRTRLAALFAAADMTLEERSVDVQITRLRKKIEYDTSRPIHIQTRRGEGYVLQAQREE